MTQFATGSEVRLTDSTSASQITPLPDGGYVIFTTRADPGGFDGMGIYGQRFTAAGQPFGAEFHVNSYTAGNQYLAAATTLRDGGLVVTWISDGQDGSGFGIYSQRYNASGEPIGGDRRVNSYTTDDQTAPSVGALSDGGYVVAWMNAVKDGSAWDIYAQRFNAFGQPVGGEQRVNLETGGYQANPAVAGLNGGNYVIAWLSNNEIYAQRFDASGQRLGGEFRVNTFINVDHAYVDVAKLEDGGFVVTWTSVGQDGSGLGIYAQRYNASGVAVGNEVLVNTTTGSNQFDSSVIGLADGGFAIAWRYDDQFNNGGIYAQVFDASGGWVGDERLVSSMTDRSFNGLTAAALADGSFTISWAHYGTQTGTFARQFTPLANNVGTGGNDNLTGTAGADLIFGVSGNDLMAGLGGNDTLAGEGGLDKLFGGAGDDILSADRINGFDNLREVDEIYGGAGNDMIFSGYGDIVDGGDGFDTVGLSYVGATAGIVGDTQILQAGQALVPGAGTFRSIERFSDIALTEFNDKMVIGDQFDPATVRAWDGDDHLVGQRVSITMYGGNGNDLLVGSIADDIIYGETGSDRILGYFGADQLWGGDGSDVFFFAVDTAIDKINDFQRGSDRIDLTGVDANAAVTGRQVLTWVGNAEFSGAAGELRTYQGASSDWYVAADVNGDRIADLLINLGSVQVGSGDFIL